MGRGGRRVGAWLGRGVKRAKRTQFGRRGPGGTRSRRRGPIVQNEPNIGHRRKKSGGDAQPTKSRSVQNEPNFPLGRRRAPERIVQNEPNLAPPVTARVARNALRRHYKREKLCETNPIPEGWPVGGIPSIPLFHHSTIPIRCRSCKTKPISGGAGGTRPRDPPAGAQERPSAASLRSAATKTSSRRDAEAQRSKNRNHLFYPASLRLCARHNSPGFRDLRDTRSEICAGKQDFMK